MFAACCIYALGFAENAEIWNGRVSMMSFFYLAGQVISSFSLEIAKLRATMSWTENNFSCVYLARTHHTSFLSSCSWTSFPWTGSHLWPCAQAWPAFWFSGNPFTCPSFFNIYPHYIQYPSSVSISAFHRKTQIIPPFHLFVPMRPPSISALRFVNYKSLDLIYAQVMSGVFVAGLVATSALFWLNQENDPVKDMTIDNLEEYM